MYTPPSQLGNLLTNTSPDGEIFVGSQRSRSHKLDKLSIAADEAKRNNTTISAGEAIVFLLAISPAERPDSYSYISGALAEAIVTQAHTTDLNRLAPAMIGSNAFLPHITKPLIQRVARNQGGKVVAAELLRELSKKPKSYINDIEEELPGSFDMLVRKVFGPSGIANPDAGQTDATVMNSESTVAAAKLLSSVRNLTDPEKKTMIRMLHVHSFGINKEDHLAWFLENMQTCIGTQLSYHLYSLMAQACIDKSFYSRLEEGIVNNKEVLLTIINNTELHYMGAVGGVIIWNVNGMVSQKVCDLPFLFLDEPTLNTTKFAMNIWNASHTLPSFAATHKWLQNHPEQLWVLGVDLQNTELRNLANFSLNPSSYIARSWRNPASDMVNTTLNTIPCQTVNELVWLLSNTDNGLFTWLQGGYTANLPTEVLLSGVTTAGLWLEIAQLSALADDDLSAASFYMKACADAPGLLRFVMQGNADRMYVKSVLDYLTADFGTDKKLWASADRSASGAYGITLRQFVEITRNNAN